MRPPGPWIRQEIFFTGEEKEWSNIYWWIPSAAPNLTTFDFTTCAMDLQGLIMTDFTNLLAITCKTRGCYLTVNDGTASVGFDYYADAGGTKTGALVPEDVALVVQLLSATPTRSGRGRIYLSGLTTDSVAGSYLSVSGTTAVDGLIVALNSSAFPIGSGLTVKLGVVSSKLGLIHPVTNINAVALLGTNRKRKTRF